MMCGIENMGSMIKNYFIIAVRNLFRNQTFALINILGLAIGMAASILILIYVEYELNYDRFHNESEQIYRVAVDGRMSGDFFSAAVSPAPLAPELKRSYPEVENAVRLRNISQEALLSAGDKRIYESNLMMADSAFFEIFTFEPVYGDLLTALDAPLSIILTETLAHKLFDQENPVGQVLKFNNETTLKVSAVIADVPGNTHFDFHALVSWSSMKVLEPWYSDNNWGSLAYYAYVKLADEANPEAFEQKIRTVIMDKIIIESGESPEVFEDFQMEFNAFLQPVKDIHLHSNLMAEVAPTSNPSYVYTFSAIAIFILLIACINFMNLTTARSAGRAKEVGVRKVHGACKKQLIRQFIIESIILSLTSLVIALLLVEIFLPYFGEVVNRQLNPGILTNPGMVLRYLFLAVVVGFIAGSYPAFYLSSFQPADVLKNIRYRGTRRSVGLRNVLVVFQFAISVFLIIGTGIINHQIEYMQNRRLGFDKERVLVVEMRSERLRNNVQEIINQLRLVPVVEQVSASTMNPGNGSDGSAYFPEGESANDPWLIFHAGVDYNYIETMKMTMIRGRSFSREFGTDTAAVIINKTLWDKLGWGEDVLGKTFTPNDPLNTKTYEVIGVVDDFYFASLHEPVEPFIFHLRKQGMRNICIRLHPGDIAGHLKEVEQAWRRLEPDFPFDYRFIDQAFDELYHAEIRLSKMYIYFSIVAIFIACLGLFGLSSFMAEQRTKEIGIRKTFGATASGLSLMLTKDFTKWIGLSNLFAWPAAYYLMDRWLNQFAYRIRIVETWDVFVYAAIFSYLIAVITVSFQAFRAASVNPVHSLKYE